MGVDDAGRRVEPRIRDAPKADAPVVARHVLQQPFDRVVGVRALVDVRVPFRRVDVRAHLDEIALGEIPAAHILKHEDVPGAIECL